jgi:hypothetical protein
MSNDFEQLLTEGSIPVDTILKWREYQFALKNGRASTASESPESGPLSHEQSLTAAVKYVLKSMGFAMYAPQIRGMLRQMGYPVEKYKGNILLSINPTLRRLVAKGLVRKIRDEGRNCLWTKYEWIDSG